MKTVRVFGWTNKDREFVKDFESLADAIEWAKSNGADITGHISVSGWLDKIGKTRKAEHEEWERFARASFEYVRGIRS